MQRLWICLIGSLILGLAGADHSHASRPVPKTITGCVINGTLYSIYTGTSEATGKKTLTVYPMKVGQLDLTTYEGKKIRVRGNLLPGDRFTADQESIQVLGPCDKESRKAISGKPR